MSLYDSLFNAPIYFSQYGQRSMVAIFSFVTIDDDEDIIFYVYLHGLKMLQML